MDNIVDVVCEDIDVMDTDEGELDLSENINDNFFTKKQTANETVKSLVDDLKSGKIKRPTWQRGSAWDNKRKSLFIESILLDMPLPLIYLSKDISDKTNKKVAWDIVDGQQRLSSLEEFNSNKFKLTGLEKLKELNGEKFISLCEDHQDKIQYQALSITRIETNDCNFIYMLFNRLNTGGVALNPMEIRNCIFHGTLLDNIKDMIEKPKGDGIKWLINDKLCPNTSKEEDYKNKDPRMYALQLILTFLAPGIPKKGLKRHINDYCKQYQNISTNDFDILKDKLNMSITFGRELFGDDYAFTLPLEWSLGKNKKSKGNFSVAMFRVFATSFSLYEKHILYKHRDSIKNAFNDILNDKDFERYICQGSSYMSKAYDKWRDKLSSVIVDNEPDKRLFDKDIKESLYDNDRKCNICKNEIIDIKFSEVDHIVPYSKGGTTSIDNAQLVCKACNKQKSNN